MFAITTTVLLLLQEWRIILITLIIQYAGVFILVGLTWPFEMAMIKVLSGFIASIILWIELVRYPDFQSSSLVDHHQELRNSDRLFRVFMAFLVGLAIYSLADDTAKWILNASYQQIFGSLLLMGMGILILGITNTVIKGIVGLLTFFSGFEILFATLETSVLIAAFFSFITLGIAFLGAYIITTMELMKET